LELPNFSLWFGRSLYKFAKFQLFTLSRSWLFGKTYKRGFRSPLRNPGAKLPVFRNFPLVLVVSVYESAKFQLFISSRTGLAVLYKYATHFGLPEVKFSGFQIFSFGLSVPLQVCKMSASYLIYKWVRLKKCKRRFHFPFRPPGVKFPGFGFFPLAWAVPLQFCQVPVFYLIYKWVSFFAQRYKR
jgi:hypothetical protein